MSLTSLWRVATIGGSSLFHTTYCSLCRSTCSASLCEVDRDGIEIRWDDTVKNYYHNVWLRHNCKCPLCVEGSSGQKTVQPAELTSYVAKVNIKDDMLRLTWRSDNGEHEGYIPLQWLKQNSYSEEVLEEKRRGAKPKVAPKGHLPAISYDDVMDSDEGLWRWLRSLNEYGLCIINNVPTISGTVEQVGKRIALIQETIYGKLFDVIVTEKPINIAYTGTKLSLHMDLIYYESPPGLQLLHCLRNDEEVIGGESLLLDSYPVLEEMRIQHPEEFDTLTKIPATFQKIHYTRQSPVHMIKQIPHIVLDDNSEIIEVSWSPPFEGPLSVPPGDILAYYKAYTLLDKMLNSSDRLLQFRLLPGQLISFNNRRVLHGRNRFNPNGGIRHLEGAYINIDEFNCRFCVLNRKFGTGQPKRIFNHSSL